MSGALREILAVFGAEWDPSGLKKGEAGVEGFKSTLKGLAVVAGTYFGLHKVADFAGEILESADALAKSSEALGVNAADLQGWQWAAQLSGSSAEEFTAAFTKFNRNLSEAAKGTGPAADALKSFGVTADQIKNKTPLALLDDLAAGLEGVQDPAKRTAGFMALFGKSGARLLPLFLEGKEGIKKLRAEVDELGMSFDEAFLEDAQEINDNLDRLKGGVKGLVTQAIKPLLPLMVQWTHGAIEVAKTFIPMIRNSSAGKAALIAFGGAALVALAPLLLPLAGIALAFLEIEDALTFLEGGDSVLGDWIEDNFGEGSADKVRAFVKMVAGDFVPTMKAALAIFTDGQPLDVKFRELDDYLNSRLSPDSAAVFHGMSVGIHETIDAVAELISIVKDVTRVLLFIPKNAIGLGTAVGQKLSDLKDADESREQVAEYEREYRAKTGTQNWSDKVGAFFGVAPPEVKAPAAPPIDARTIRGLFGGGGSQDNSQNIRDLLAAAPALAAAAEPTQQVAQAPAPYLAQQPAVNQTVQAPITQNFYGIETPAEAGKAAARGAKSGVTEGGERLRTQRALVPGPV
jgi:hypothetical protein